MPVVFLIGMLLCILIGIGNVMTLNHCERHGGRASTPFMVTVCDR